MYDWVTYTQDQVRDRKIYATHTHIHRPTKTKFG